MITKNHLLIALFIVFFFIGSADAGKSPIFAYAEEGDIEHLERLISEGINIDFKDDLGFTALMTAADNGKLEAVKLLVKHKADINARNNDGDTPLMRAANAGHFDVVRFLVEKGADTNAYHGNDKKATAYAYAKQNGHNQIANYLKSRTSIAASSRSGDFKIWPGMPKNKGHYNIWQASCDEGGTAWVNVEHDSRDVYGWGAIGFSGAIGSSDAFIGVEAALRKACRGK